MTKFKEREYIGGMTISEIIDAFGGTTAVARLFGVTPPAVSNWRAAGRIPPRLHLRVIREAERRQIKIDPDSLEAA